MKIILSFFALDQFFSYLDTNKKALQLQGLLADTEVRI